MTQDLTPRVIEASDVDTFDRDTGRVRRYTVITYRLGELGPFREEFEHGSFTEAELRERMQRKAATLRSIG